MRTRKTKNLNVPRLALDADEAAACLGIGRSKLYELHAEGRIKAIDPGTRGMRFPIRELEAFLAREAR